MEAKFSVKLPTNLQVAMDKKTNKDTDKKTERVRDRGDLKKTSRNKPNMEVKAFLPDRGDSQIPNLQSSSKPYIDRKKPAEDSIKSIDSQKKILNKKEAISTQNRTYLDLEGRKCLRERYTVKFKSKNPDVKVENKEHIHKNEKKTEELITKDCESSKNSIYTEHRTDKPMKEALCSQRKPIIKTVTVKNGNHVYKAVTFIDQKHHTPLRINIPSENKKKVKDPSLKVKLKLSQESIKEKPVQKVVKPVKKLSNKKRLVSPELNMKTNSSPPTEVAKWAPSCINHHTKPYYEAWVDTTLAAITKCSKNDKLYIEKQNIIQSFKRALLQRPETPELVHVDYNNERYTGKIKIRQR